MLDPTGKCPAFIVNPKIARLALQKQRADEVEYARLLKDNVSAAPIYSGLDGGMNKVFTVAHDNAVPGNSRAGRPPGGHKAQDKLCNRRHLPDGDTRRTFPYRRCLGRRANNTRAGSHSFNSRTNRWNMVARFDLRGGL